jgi:hypothetical protein
MNTKTKLNGNFELARAGLAAALDELQSAQNEYGTLLNLEATLSDQLNGLTVKASDSAAVEKKSSLQHQIAECRSQSRVIESKRLPKCRERVAGALSECSSPYREQLGKEITAERTRLVRTLRDFYRDESAAVAAAERSDKISFLISHLRITWANNTADVAMAQLVLGRMKHSAQGQPLIEWPPPEPSPG